MRTFIIFILFALVFSSCKNDYSGELMLRFRLKYGNQDLKMFENYNYPATNEKLIFSRIAFYISNIQLVKGNEQFDLKEIDFLDLTNAHTSPGGKGYFEYKIKDVKQSRYDKLLFAIGVPQEQNAKEPKDFQSSNVLSSTADYWTAWKSYIFMRNEGRIDMNGDNETETSFALHLGGDQAYIPVEINRSFSIDENQTTILDIQIDMQKLFNGKTQYNIREATQIHSLSQVPFMLQLVENLKTGIN